MRTLEEKAAKLAESIARQVEKSAGKGLQKAILFAEARVKEEASVKAPTRTSASGRVYATEKATPGAPLRVVTGRFRQSITSYMQDENTGVVGSNARAPISESAAAIKRIFGVSVEDGFPYINYHEIPGFDGYKNAGKHQTFQPTFAKYMKELAVIVGSEVKVGLS